MGSKCNFNDLEIEFTPDAIKEEERAVLPQCSKERYLKAYNHFMNWRSAEKEKPLSENVFLAYFKELSDTLQPSTLWSIYSMLKSTISINHNVNLKKFMNLTVFLKRQSENFKSKKSKTFTADEIERFLNEASDEIYLATKVVLIFGICGACRSSEFTKITVSDVEKHNQIISVTLRNTNNKIDQQFVIREEFVSYIEKYQNLRPENLSTDRYFLNYQRGKCLKQVIGKNKFASMPKQIATYLNLPNADLYTGHCFRRTSTTLLADSRASISILKRHRSRKSSTVTEEYIEDSVDDKSEITTKITEGTNIHSERSLSPQPGTSTTPEPDIPQDPLETHSFFEENIQTGSCTIQGLQVSQKISNIKMPGKNLHFTFSNCSNFTFNFH